MGHDVIRVVRFSPYRRGQGPVFTLRIWDTYQTTRDGKSVLGYRLTMSRTRPRHSPGCVRANDAALREICTCARLKPRVIFEAEDFAVPVMYSIDSDATVVALMGFLTLKPGDTDAEYFASDTDVQRDYRTCNADSLAMAVESRFGTDL